MPGLKVKVERHLVECTKQCKASQQQLAESAALEELEKTGDAFGALFCTFDKVYLISKFSTHNQFLFPIVQYRYDCTCKIQIAELERQSSFCLGVLAP